MCWQVERCVVLPGIRELVPQCWATQGAFEDPGVRDRVSNAELPACWQMWSESRGILFQIPKIVHLAMHVQHGRMHDFLGSGIKMSSDLTR